MYSFVSKYNTRNKGYCNSTWDSIYHNTSTKKEASTQIQI